MFLNTYSKGKQLKDVSKEVLTLVKDEQGMTLKAAVWKMQEELKSKERPNVPKNWYHKQIAKFTALWNGKATNGNSNDTAVNSSKATAGSDASPQLWKQDTFFVLCFYF